MKPEYKVARIATPPAMDGRWDSPGWRPIAPLTVAHFHPRSSIHRPIAEAKVAHSDAGIHILFRILDRFVRVANSGFQAPVWKDSCVEFFVRPRGDGGYINFETNAGGSLLAFFIEDWTRTGGPEGFRKFCKLDPKWNDSMPRFHTLPEGLEPPVAEPVTWSLQYTIPWALFAEVAGAARPAPGETWTANFYKCGDETTHPHWAAWSPVGEALNFHAPQFFGTLVFG